MTASAERVGLLEASSHMRRFAAIAMIWLLSGLASAHEDRILPIRANGTLGDLPAAYGSVRVDISRAAGNPKMLTGVSLTSPRFHVSLNQCVIAKLGDVVHIEASGSWYHTQTTMPAYISLTFYSGEYDPRRTENEYYAITFSLVDGRILMGMRAWDPIIGRWRGRLIDWAEECPSWRRSSAD